MQDKACSIIMKYGSFLIYLN